MPRIVEMLCTGADSAEHRTSGPGINLIQTCIDTPQTRTALAGDLGLVTLATSLTSA